jgi:hypothetical protein
MRSEGSRAAVRIFLLAIAITAIHTIVVAACSGRTDPAEAWGALYQFDGGWFRSVAESGYHFPAEPYFEHAGNVAFFPGYPLLAKALMRATGLPTDVSLLITAELASVGFWIYFLLLLKRWGVSTVASAACIALVVGHPGAFFMVCSYSESTFLLALAGFVYWSGRSGPTAAVLAALHGVLMTAARLVGLPVVAFPLLVEWSKRSGWRGYAKGLAVGLIAALGAAGFAAYLEVEIGQWNVFAKSHEAGWNVHPDPFAFFRQKTWALRYGEVVTVWWDVAALDRLLVPLTVLHFLILTGLEFLARRGGRPTRWRERVPLYLIAFALFAVPVISHASRGMSSMTRFALCWDVVLVLALAGLLADRPEWTGKWWVRIVLFGGALWFASIQPTLAYKFTHSEFVG